MLLDKKAGPQRVVAVTADHGMPAEPAPGHRHYPDEIVAALVARFERKGNQAPRPHFYQDAANNQLHINANRLRVLGLSLKDLATFLGRSGIFCGGVYRGRGGRGSAAPHGDSFVRWIGAWSLASTSSVHHRAERSGFETQISLRHDRSRHNRLALGIKLRSRSWWTLGAVTALIHVAAFPCLLRLEPCTGSRPRRNRQDN